MQAADLQAVAGGLQCAPLLTLLAVGPPTTCTDSTDGRQPPVPPICGRMRKSMHRLPSHRQTLAQQEGQLLVRVAPSCSSM